MSICYGLMHEFQNQTAISFLLQLLGYYNKIFWNVLFFKYFSSQVQQEFSECSRRYGDEFHDSGDGGDVCQLLRNIVEECVQVFGQCHTAREIRRMQDLHIEALIDQYKQFGDLNNCPVVKEYRLVEAWYLIWLNTLPVTLFLLQNIKTNRWIQFWYQTAWDFHLMITSYRLNAETGYLIVSFFAEMGNILSW